MGLYYNHYDVMIRRSTEQMMYLGFSISAISLALYAVVIMTYSGQITIKLYGSVITTIFEKACVFKILKTIENYL